MKIDIFAHILPGKYLETFSKMNSKVMQSREVKNRAVIDLDMRLRLMDRYPGVLQVLTIALPPMESLLKPADAVELAKIANDELAELLVKYPDKFIAAAACLPLDDMDAALEEADRAITKLGLKGVQIFGRVNGDTLDMPKFIPLYEKMSGYDLPIWIHPCSDDILDEPLLGWPYATASAMLRLVKTGIFSSHPDIKFITHHCGSMIPYFEYRIKWLGAHALGAGYPVRNPVEHFRKFYNDTGLYGGTSALMCGYNFFGADRLLFGTDAPLGPSFGLTMETIRSIERMSISDADREKIFTQNALSVLKMAI